MPTSKKSPKKTRFEVHIKFLPDELGNTYELEFAKLTVKAVNKAKALTMGIDWIDGRWTEYDMTVREK